MEIEFPIEFTVLGTPVSSQNRNERAKLAWREMIQASSKTTIPQSHFASDRKLAVTLYYYPIDRMQGDVDNIVKPILDAMCRHIYLDDHQVERLVVQKFEADCEFTFSYPSAALAECMRGAKPALYVRVSADPYEDLRL